MVDNYRVSLPDVIVPDVRASHWADGGRAAASPEAGWHAVERGLVAVALIALGMRSIVHAGLTTGFALALLLAPVWISKLRHFRTGRLLLGILIATALWGVILSMYDSSTHTVNGTQRLGITVLLLGTAVGIGLILWARHLFSIPAIGALLGFGMLIGALTAAGGGGNPWKFVWAVPTAIFLLSLAAIRRSHGLELTALIVLIFMSAIFDSRSYAGTFALAAILVIWQMRPKGMSRRASWISTALLMGVLTVGLYYAGTALLVDGYLGADAQQRSISQIETSGSLILGGRPELGATIALIRENPSGFGSGVVPSQADVLVAKAGMKSLGYEPNNGYVERFMFGGHIELHSVFGDIWADSGVVGIVALVLIAFVVVRGLAYRVANRSADGVLIFLCLWTMWNLLFSPIFASQPTLMITLGFVLTPVALARGDGDADQSPRWYSR